MDEYQMQASSTDLTPDLSAEVLSISFMDKVLGLVGESGEFADKIKKLLRDKQGKMSDEDRQELVKELGDVLWYVAVLAPRLGVSLEEVARKNLDKLSGRQKASKLSGRGDNR